MKRSSRDYRGLKGTIGLILAIALMVGQATQHLQGLEKALQYVTAPMYRLSDSLHVWWHSWWVSADLFDLLEEENATLKAKLLLTQAQMRHLEGLKSENTQLMKLLRSSTAVAGKVEVARVLAVDLHQSSSDFLIDKGEKDHIYVGQPVLDGYGVVGQVVKIMPRQSMVRDLRNLHSGIPVEVERNQVRGIVAGEGLESPLTLRYLSSSQDIKPGDVLVTSGLGQQFSQGYPVGIVQSVSGKHTHAFLDIVVVPKARLDQFRQVLLAWPSKNVQTG